MTFTLLTRQHGTLNVTPEQADGTTPGTATAISAVSSDETVVTVQPNPGFPDQFIVHSLSVVGSATVTVSGINKDGDPISTPFDFDVSRRPPSPDAAVGFSATFTGVGDD